MYKKEKKQQHGITIDFTISKKFFFISESASFSGFFSSSQFKVQECAVKKRVFSYDEPLCTHY